jgi:DNA modification methylase
MTEHICPKCGSKKIKVREPGIVYDPFVGSGTTAAVAFKLGRRYIGLDLNSDYAEIARWRIGQLSRRLDEFEEKN